MVNQQNWEEEEARGFFTGEMMKKVNGKNESAFAEVKVERLLRKHDLKLLRLKFKDKVLVLKYQLKDEK